MPKPKRTVQKSNASVKREAAGKTREVDARRAA
jgi:hypothetical protein